MQKINISIDNSNGKSKFLAGKIGNTIGRTIRFIIIQTKMPYTTPESKALFFKNEI
jgi:hypothetical protein